MKRWEDLPREMQNEEVRRYYNILQKKTVYLFCKRAFDIIVSGIMLICFSWLFLFLAIAIKIDSGGPVFYRQERICQYGHRFRIHKFRTMVNGADRMGNLITAKNDIRITRVGKTIRRFRLDEISQLIDVFLGNMSFVGPRPEVGKFVDRYTPEMMATLLLPAGMTSEASIKYKDEDELLDGAEDIEKVYIEEVLPGKMNHNLKSIEKLSFFGDIAIMFKTVYTVLKKW